MYKRTAHFTGLQVKGVTKPRGSFLPDLWEETYATADIVEYDGNPSVKIGREFLVQKN